MGRRFARTRPRPPTAAADPDATHRRSVRRSTNALRQFAVANALTLLVTVTFESARAVEAVAPEVKRLVKRLRRSGGYADPLPWLAVVHGHRPGTRAHSHLLLPAGPTIDPAGHWHLGRTDVRTVPSVQELRDVCQYLSKEFDLMHGQGKSRWPHAKGFTPERLVVPVETFGQAMLEAELRMGPPDHVSPWDSPWSGGCNVTWD